MIWNWQQTEWPNFTYQKDALAPIEGRFLHQSGVLIGCYQHLHKGDQSSLTIELISEEAFKTSEIEGELLNRDSLQSSIRRQFGLQSDHRKIAAAEKGIAEMMVDLYRSFAEPLTHEKLFDWHLMLVNGRWDLNDVGRYRTHTEPMQIVSGSVSHPKIHFEAPPSGQLEQEMERFIHWFNQTAPNGAQPLPILIRAGIAHLYFECIHPFEDGNGRIGRAIAEKALSQGLNQPTLIALSRSIQRHKKTYYATLERNNRTLEIDSWLEYFAQTVLAAQTETQAMVEFLIGKTRFYDQYARMMNERQAKVIGKLFEAGLDGFEGGLSAENYLSITKTSRATATRDLQELVAHGMLMQTGKLKSTRYRLHTH